MKQYTMKPIGYIKVENGNTAILLDEAYRAALQGLEDFQCIQVLWWFDKCDDPTSRAKLVEKEPYTKGPDTLGVFATRSPLRPNPIALSCVYRTYIDHAEGKIGLAYIDAEDGSPVLDIKPYTLSLDRVETTVQPAWCAHWPTCIEDSEEFDWENEFNF